MGYFNYDKAENSYSRQFATAYAVYMMLGSYFRKCRMVNALEESHLRMHYASMKTGDQYLVEEQADEDAVALLENERVDDLHCEVQTRLVKGIYHILFRTGLTDFRADVDRRGRVSFHRVAAAL